MTLFSIYMLSLSNRFTFPVETLTYGSLFPPLNKKDEKRENSHNCEFVSCKSDFISRNCKFIFQNCEFMSRNYDFMTHNCKFISRLYCESELRDKKSQLSFFIQWRKRASILIQRILKDIVSSITLFLFV